MNEKANWLLAGWLVVVLLAGGIVNAQALPGERALPMEPAAEFKPSLEKANELVGAKVLNDKKERLGTVEDIVLTPDHTAISYVVLSHGGLWGWGGKLFAVPWSEFNVAAEDNVLVLSNVNPADLENAKGFDKKDWPAKAHENWLGRDIRLDAPGARPGAVEMPRDDALEDDPMADTYEHREHAGGEHMMPRSDRPGSPGVAEPPVAKADIKYRRLSELVGLTIKNNEGEELGELEDIVIDTHEGKVAYAVLSMRSGFLGLDKDLAAIPWASFQILPRLGTARLNADKETLQAIAFDEDAFPNLADREYSSRIHERFGATPYWEAYGFVPGRERERPEMSPWKEGSEYDSLYSPENLKTIHGTILSVGTFRPEGTAVEGLRLRIKTDEGDRITVHAGPRPYVVDQKIDFHYGDEVTITGTPGKMGWRDVFVASQIKTGDKTLDLRTKEGKPRWNVDEFKEEVR
jgi:sporulation protein YlmC with PRC-barrel domain